MVAPIAAPRPEVRSWKSRVGLSPAGTASLAAVVSVLVLVSLARLRPLMTHENQVDARQTVQLLAKELAEWRTQRGNHGLVPQLEQLAEEAVVRQALSDGVFADSGGLLKRHGYLFAVVELTPPPGQGTAPGEVLAAERTTGPATAMPEPHLGILAWPFKHGSSGAEALLCTAGDRLFRHANTRAQWSGPEAPIAMLPSWNGWRELKR